MARVVVGMSGGVDSSVAAALLVAGGYDVTGVYLTCWEEPGCRTDQDRKDALRVATQLGIRFEVLDFRTEYREKVVEYFYKEYEAGRTPNPDVVCNREIKFGLFYDWAISHDFDYVATGHYAKIMHESTNEKTQKYFLQRPKDLSKDQTYFLWEVTPEKLAHVLFPLGDMLKTEVRAKARTLGLPTAAKPDSMGICFIGEVDVTKLLREKLGEKPGPVMWDGHIIGQHGGLWFYTVGQRGGWTLDHTKQKTTMPPLYVVGKEIKTNKLLVGTREQTIQTRFRIQDMRFMVGEQELESLVAKGKLSVRIRNLGDLFKVVQMHKQTNEQVELQVAEPIFGVAEGQSGVLYDDLGRIVCGGIICMSR